MIYLSNLIICICVAIISEILYMCIAFIIGMPLFGGLQMELSEFVLVMVNTILIIISFTSIFNLISMLCSEISISTISCIVIFITMYIIISSLYLTINTSQYTTTTYYDENGVANVIERKLNPNYPGEKAIKNARMIYSIIPQGQAMDISVGETKYLSKYPIYSTTLIIITNIVGIYLFNRKELK